MFVYISLCDNVHHISDTIQSNLWSIAVTRRQTHYWLFDELNTQKNLNFNDNLTAKIFVTFSLTANVFVSELKGLKAWSYYHIIEFYKWFSCYKFWLFTNEALLVTFNGPLSSCEHWYNDGLTGKTVKDLIASVTADNYPHLL